MDNDKDIQEAGEQVGRAVKAETNKFTGSVKYNFKDGRVVNWNIGYSGWPERKGRRLTGKGVAPNLSKPVLVGEEESPGRHSKVHQQT